MKKCSSCKLEKQETEFYKDSRTKSGLYSRCRECVSPGAKKRDGTNNRVKTPCEQCSVIFYKRKTEYENRTQHFCSRPCHVQYQRHNKPSEETRRKLSEAGKKTYKGELAGYTAIHKFIYAYHGKAMKCENVECVYPRIATGNRKMMQKPSRYEWANISGEYKRDISDWMQLCPSCHRKRDLEKKNKKLK